MPRRPRLISETGIYHIMLRGINKQNIFNDEQDKEKFLDSLKRYKKICEYKIYAYCLMSNHIHLLIETTKEHPGLIMKRLAGSYVYWYNLKYKRIGSLFQDRYRSEPVETEQYFLTVLRYIHQNPVKAGICDRISDYKYSSYLDYLNGNKLVDSNFCFDIIDAKQFVQFNNEYTDEMCLDIEENNFKITDEEALLIIQEISNLKIATELQEIDRAQREKYLKLCRDCGISIRQLSKLTGISISTIRKL